MFIIMVSIIIIAFIVTVVMGKYEDTTDKYTEETTKNEDDCLELKGE